MQFSFLFYFKLWIHTGYIFKGRYKLISLTNIFAHAAR